MNTSGQKYDFLKNKTCPYCQSKIKSNADVIICSHCGTPHHRECWDENQGCTTYGCINNPATEKKINVNYSGAKDVGNKTIDEIKKSISGINEIKTIVCPECGSETEENSVYCRQCGFNMKENKFPDSDAKKEFDREFKKRYKEKVGITRNRFYLTLGSFLLLTSAVALLFYISITKLNAYFSSDEYLIKNTIENWKEAWEDEDINKYKSYMTDDYEYYGKDGKKAELKDRLKRIEWTFKNYKNIRIKFTDYKLITDSTTSENDRKILFNQNYESDKFSEKGIKTLRMYKGTETNGEWKIYREFFD